MNPTLVLCMAGVYRRFKEAGYRTPKYLLPAPAGTVLAWILRELRPTAPILVANERDQAWADAIVDAVGQPHTLLWTGDTRGQAETAALGARAAEAAGREGPIFFHNVDTVLFERDLTALGAALAHAEGLIDLLEADHPGYSYVRVDARHQVLEIAEKRVISRLATTGLYGFASPRLYLEAAQATATTGGGEFYISQVYAHLLARGARLLAPPPTAEQGTLILGTPAEYEAAAANGWAGRA